MEEGRGDRGEYRPPMGLVGLAEKFRRPEKKVQGSRTEGMTESVAEAGKDR